MAYAESPFTFDNGRGERLSGGVAPELGAHTGELLGESTRDAAE